MKELGLFSVIGRLSVFAHLVTVFLLEALIVPCAILLCIESPLDFFA
jgi:hypothetical protein